MSCSERAPEKGTNRKFSGGPVFGFMRGAIPPGRAQRFSLGTTDYVPFALLSKVSPFHVPMRYKGGELRVGHLYRRNGGRRGCYSFG